MTSWGNINSVIIRKDNKPDEIVVVNKNLRKDDRILFTEKSPSDLFKPRCIPFKLELKHVEPISYEFLSVRETPAVKYSNNSDSILSRVVVCNIQLEPVKIDRDYLLSKVIQECSCCMNETSSLVSMSCCKQILCACCYVDLLVRSGGNMKCMFCRNTNVQMVRL